MKRLWSGNDPMFMAVLQSELQARGIEFLMKNELLRGGMGEIPFSETWPQLFIMDEKRLQEAQEILRDLTSPEA